MGVVFKVEFCMENIFVRNRTTLIRKKQTTQKNEEITRTTLFCLTVMTVSN